MTEVCAETINGNIDLHTTFNSQSAFTTTRTCSHLAYGPNLTSTNVLWIRNWRTLLHNYEQGRRFVCIHQMAALFCRWKLYRRVPSSRALPIHFFQILLLCVWCIA